MKKSVLLLLWLLVVGIPALYADHIKGGEIIYAFLGYDDPPANTIALYRIRLNLYLDCNATGQQIDPSVALTLFTNNGTSLQFRDTVNIPMSSLGGRIRFDPASNKCIGNPPTNICYELKVYDRVIKLPVSTYGYVIAYQRCCRVEKIFNLESPSDAQGATYFTQIPGTSVLAKGYEHNSPELVRNEATAICAGSNFSYSSAVQYKTSDSVKYRFCPAFTGGSTAIPDPRVARSPFYELRYEAPFSGLQPLGPNVTIDSFSGQIRGKAPAIIGQYVMSVCIDEFRQGKLINIHRKDIHIAVSDCYALQAALQPNYTFCEDLKVTFRNELTNPVGTKFIWDFGDGSKPDTSLVQDGNVTHQYTQPGNYKVKLKADLSNGQCTDTTITLAKVWPGFFPGFTVSGSCIQNPYQFFDTTKTVFGNVVKWRWNFGDETKNNDTSISKNPSWTYTTTGFKTIQLSVESDSGCKKDFIKIIEVADKPPLSLKFRDTLICTPDALQLEAVGGGTFSWSPLYNIINSNTATPTVNPTTTTWYKVLMLQDGCTNNDSVKVRVVDYVTLAAGNDTTICTKDSIRLAPSSDGLRYVWTPDYQLNNSTLKNPQASPLQTTTYLVTAYIGSCFTTDDITIRTVPYPGSNAGVDTSICYQDTAQLHGLIQGINFNWSPISTLSLYQTLDPLAFPLQTTTYTLKVYDTLGCPKPGTSQVTVNVYPPIIANAGGDTAVVLGQPLQLKGSGAPFFSWSPPTYLNDPSSPNPIAQLSDNFTYYMKTYNAIGCFDLDTINIRVFKTKPDIFVPNAFMPTGFNKVLRPIAVGLSRLNYFRVYNRWGQLVFQTTSSGMGWDGTLGGQLQDSGTFIWIAAGVDYTGKPIVRKGSAVLIR